MTKLLSFGHGYCASALTPVILPKGAVITATNRTQITAGRPAGVTSLVWPDGDPAHIRRCLAKATHLLISIAPGADGDPVLNALGAEIAAAKQLKWVGYLSTTAVYGDHEGAWVDEDTPPNPSTARGQWRVDAEAAWRRVCDQNGAALTVLRLAGIYGPGRGPFEKLRNGTARCIIKPGQVFSRIHVDDIARALDLAMAWRSEGIFNLCDDAPAPPEDVIRHAATLLGLPAPRNEPFETAEMSPMARSFYGESKRVSNARAKAELGWQPRYKDYQSGLAAILAAEKCAKSRANA